ncbi:C40 family peptidase [Gudongella sp. DL1XJH-153]|uniref:C40 family peptidase n=1 Tax=Gudongella sp. DL1XJH-153 TaxID=3409804 RepID=UPI003BB76091
MHNRKHKLAFKTLVLCMLMGVAFKDTGIFIKDFALMNDQTAEIMFAKEEEVKVAKEGSDSYQVLKDGTYYSIPKDVMIRTTRSSDRYTVKEPVTMYKEQDVNSQVVKEIQPGEELVMASYNETFGYFITAKSFHIGYVHMNSTQRNITENISYGMSNITRVLKNGENTLVLVKGGSVGVKNFQNGQFEIVDDEMNSYFIEETAVTLFRTLEQASRAAERGTGTLIAKIVDAAHREIGKPYVYAAAGPNAYDCSGFTYALFKNELGIMIPRVSSSQGSAGVKVEKSQLIPGDLVFFNTTGRGISHVGLYIGDGNMIHASSGKRQVRIDTINSGYYSQRYVTGRRVIN